MKTKNKLKIANRIIKLLDHYEQCDTISRDEIRAAALKEGSDDDKHHHSR